MKDTIREDWVLSVELPEGRGVVELRRCDDRTWLEMRSRSMPILMRDDALMSIVCTEVGLPGIYAALTVSTGPSSMLFDEWKGAFAFPFRMIVRRGGREHVYLLRLTSYRSMVEPDLHRLLCAGETHDGRVYHPPFDEELTASDMWVIVSYIRGFIEGFLKTMPRWTTPFVKEIPSNLILFGYDPASDAFFTRGFDEEGAYREALSDLRSRFF